MRKWIQGFGRKTTLGASTALFNVADRHVTHPYWQRHALIGDDFRSHHMLLMLHIWMIHKRLLKEGKRGLAVQESLFDLLWDNTNDRMHKKGIPEISLNKYLKEVQSYSFRTCVELDQALDQLKLPLEDLNAKKLKDMQEIEPDTALSTLQARTFKNTEEAVVDSLAGALWRGLYLRREDIDEAVVLSMARYVRSEQDRLLTLPAEAFFEGRFTFQSVVPFLNISQSGIKAGSGPGAETAAPSVISRSSSRQNRNPSS
jgi:hypothetical protein